jgi:hypothetical protein
MRLGRIWSFNHNWAAVGLENDYPLLSFTLEFPFPSHRLQEQVRWTPAGKCTLQDH